MSAEKDLTQRNGEAESTARRAPALRFKGFDDEWKVKSLGKIATMFAGGTPLSSVGEYYGGDISWVSISDMTSAGKYILETEKKLTLLGFESCSAKMFPENTLLFAMYASIGKCCISPCPVASSQAILGIHKLKGVEIEFLYQELVARESEFVKMGQTGSQANLSKQIVENISIYLPSLPEQRKIGACFRALDGLIAGREEALGKLLDLKKAMLERMFPQGARRVPEVRFKGFDDEWEVKRLGEAFDTTISNNTFSRASLSEIGLVGNIHYGDVLIKYGALVDVGRETIPFVADEKFKVTSKNRLRDGDIIMADTAEDETVGKVVEMRGIGNRDVVSGLHTIILRPRESYAPGFLGYYMNAGAFHDGLCEIMQGVKVLSVNKSSLSDRILLVPSLPEQRKIGAYFRALDGLIAARREEVGKLKELKKALLGQMFA